MFKISFDTILQKYHIIYISDKNTKMISTLWICIMLNVNSYEYVRTLIEKFKAYPSKGKLCFNNENDAKQALEWVKSLQIMSKLWS